MMRDMRVRSRLGLGIMAILAGLVTVFTLWSCGDDSSTKSPASPPRDPSVIGPNGGTFTDDGSGVTIEVPPGALSTETLLSCTHYATEDDIPDIMQSSIIGALGVVSLGPDGLEFDSAVTLTVPVSTALTPGEQFPLYVWNAPHQSWEMTEFVCTAAADGLSYSVQVTHFSDYGGDNTFGAEGAFGNLDATHWCDVHNAFNQWIGMFTMTYGQDRIKQMRDCCMKVTGRRFRVNYDAAIRVQDSSISGDVENYDKCENYEVTIGTIGAELYLYLTIEIFWSCQNPDEVRVQASRTSIDLADVTARTSQVKASVGCDYRRMVGIPMAFTLEGPGSISPASTQTGADGYAYTTYTATDTGTAVITATATSCDQWQKPRNTSESVSIEVDSCHNWTLIVEMTVTHSTLNFDFQDEITMIIPLVISESGEITSRTTDADGTHSASLVTFGPDCVVTQAYTPDFIPGAIGNVVGSTAYVTIAPVAEWALLYVVTCIVDDEPYYIPMPPYNYLIPSLMASQMFNEYPVVLENGNFYNGSGVDTEWSEDSPISYTYYIVVHGEE